MTQTLAELCSSDIIDLRDVSERIEELESNKEDQGAEFEDQEELDTLNALMEELKSGGGDHDWRGDWYPGSMIRDSYFAEYVQELAEDIGAVDKDNASWVVIDWEATADGVKIDYSSVTFEGHDYWYR